MLLLIDNLGITNGEKLAVCQRVNATKTNGMNHGILLHEVEMRISDQSFNSSYLILSTTP